MAAISTENINLFKWQKKIINFMLELSEILIFTCLKYVPSCFINLEVKLKTRPVIIPSGLLLALNYVR